MHVMNEPNHYAAANLPTPEQLVGREVRTLRQGRGWSQQEIADKMRAYGYEWSQATVTRLESATRPIRVNELADLAMLFGVPVVQFLDPRVQVSAWDDLDALEREIERLAATQRRIREQLDHQKALADEAERGRAEVAAHLARVEARLAALRQRVSQPAEIAQGVPRRGDRRE